MSRPPIHIIADRDIPFLKGVLEPHASVSYLPGTAIAAADVRDTEALIVRTRTRCDASLLEGSRVRMIATATIGHDHIDLRYTSSRGIEVATAAGCNARGVLQWVAAVLRTLGEPAGRVLGVVGVGNVGSLVARYGRLWGFEVLCCDPFVAASDLEGGAFEFTTPEEVARRADIISFHVPLTRSGPHPTFRMADASFFALTKPSTVIVNSSRGEVVDPQALLASSCDFVLDVWPDEPLIDRDLLGRALLATPHIAGYTLQGKANATAMSVNALARHFGWPQLTDRRPDEVARVTPKDISWQEMRALMPDYFDIEALSDSLKSHPERFEAIRDHYEFRREFF